MPYTFDAIQAFDPTDPQIVASNAEIIIHAPNDSNLTPITITDTTGVQLPNPYLTNDLGAVPAFIAEIERVAWTSGELTSFLTSWEGLRDAAEEAKTSAAAAAGNAVEAVQEQLSGFTGSVDASRAAAESAAAAAAASAGLVGAPAGEAVRAAIGPGGAAEASLKATIEEYGGAQLKVADAVGEYAWNYPMALYRDSPSPRTYFGASDAAGNLLACYFEHSTGKTRRKVIGTSTVVDDHHIPVPSVPEDAPQLWAWNNHNRDSLVSFRVGDRTGDLDTLGPVRTVNAGGLASYAALLRNPADPLEVWMLNRTWPTSSAYDWSIRRGVINETTKDVAWEARKTFLQFPTNPTVQGYVTVAPVEMEGGDFGFRFAATGNPTNGDFHDVLYGTVNLVTGAVESPGKTLTANVKTGTGLPMQVIDLAVIYQPPAGNTTRLFGVRDAGEPAVAIATWNPAMANSPIEYFHAEGFGGVSEGAGLVLPAGSAYGQIATPSGLVSATNFSIRTTVTFDVAVGTTQYIVARHGTSGQHAWIFQTIGSGKLRLGVYADGNTLLAADSPNAITYTVGVPISLRVDIDFATDTAKFYTSAHGATWNQVGANVAYAGNPNLTSTEPLKVGYQTTSGLAGKVANLTIQSVDGTTVYIAEDFTDGAAGWTLNGGATVDADSIEAGNQESLGLAGEPFGMATTSRYVGGLAYPTPSKGSVILRARENGGTHYLEKLSKESGEWETRALDLSTTHKLARPMPIVNQGPLETIYTAFSQYAGYTSFQGDYRGV